MYKISFKRVMNRNTNFKRFSQVGMNIIFPHNFRFLKSKIDEFFIFKAFLTITLSYNKLN